VIEFFPHHPGGVLAWAHLVLAWCLAHHALHLEPVGVRRNGAGRAGADLIRALGLGAVCAALLAPAAAALGTGLAVGLGSLVYTQGRSRAAAPRHRVDVWECCFALGIPLLLAALSANLGLRLRGAWIGFPTTDAAVAQALLVAAAFLLVTRGGSHFVRGLLDRLRIGDAPERDARLLIDPRTFAAGRVIGELERALLLLFALDGSYAAAGFLVAAKGFVRAREAADPKFAEYVVVGTLASFLFAAVIAAATRLGLQACG
jgi:hypothetical protein